VVSDDKPSFRMSDLEAIIREHGSPYAEPAVRQLTGETDVERARDILEERLKRIGMDQRWPRPAAGE
jgi:hypothetical protein